MNQRGMIIILLLVSLGTLLSYNIITGQVIGDETYTTTDDTTGITTTTTNDNGDLTVTDQDGNVIIIPAGDQTTTQQTAKIGDCNTEQVEEEFNRIFLNKEGTKKIISEEQCKEHLMYNIIGEGTITILHQKKETIPTEQRKRGTIPGYSGTYEYQEKESITATYYEITQEEKEQLQTKNTYQELNNYLQNELPKKTGSIQTWNIQDTTNAKSIYGSLYATTIIENWEQKGSYYVAKNKKITTENEKETIKETQITQYTITEQKITGYAERIYYYNKIRQELFTKKIPSYTFKSDGTEHHALYIKDYTTNYNKEKNYGIEAKNTDNKEGQYIKATHNKEDGSITFKATKGYEGTKTFQLYTEEGTTKTYSNQFSITMQSETSATPKLTKNINNINIPRGTSTTINLEEHFNNPLPGETITYHTTGNKAVKISITGNIATISIGTGYSGTERISITATNKAGSTTSNTFLITQTTNSNTNNNHYDYKETIPETTNNQELTNNKKTTEGTLLESIFNTEKPLNINTTIWAWTLGTIILILTGIILGLYLKRKQQQTTKKITENNTSTKKINDYLNGLRETIN